jgi:hypothetical protein
MVHHNPTCCEPSGREGGEGVPRESSGPKAPPNGRLTPLEKVSLKRIFRCPASGFRQLGRKSLIQLRVRQPYQ